MQSGKTEVTQENNFHQFVPTVHKYANTELQVAQMRTDRDFSL